MIKSYRLKVIGLCIALFISLLFVDIFKKYVVNNEWNVAFYLLIFFSPTLLYIGILELYDYIMKN